MFWAELLKLFVKLQSKWNGIIGTLTMGGILSNDYQ